MGNVNKNSFGNTICLCEKVEMNTDKTTYDKENYDKFINTLTGIVEKYGKVMLEELEYVA